MPARNRPSPYDPYMPQVGCALLILMLLVLCLLPLFMFDAMGMALRKLHLPPGIATLTIVGILIGGFVNLPLYRINREEDQPVLRGYMLPGVGWVPLHRASRQTIIAINLGGCLIPAALAIYESRLVLDEAPQARWALALAAGVNIVVCYTIARPIPGVGIAIPAFVPPAVAVLLSWLLLNGDQYDLVRAPVAFVAGVAGPLIGADLFNLRRIEQLSAGLVSIGGAGTFDGIVISGLAAAFFA